jgi:hypothetical protein
MNRLLPKTELSGPCLPFRDMTERLLQYIWQFQYFNRSELRTTQGDKLEVLHPGNWNSNQGPDFTDAQIKIGATQFAGSVELHIKASQWKEHGHSRDVNYRNVILHVVYENNEAGDPFIPVLELQPLVSQLLLERYSGLMHARSFIACSRSAAEIKELIWIAWKERLLAERLTRRSEQVFSFLEKNNTHWEESFWWMLARNFGIQVNSDAFEAMARSIPFTVLARHKNQIHQLEALLFGQTNLLNGQFKEQYPRLLLKEYGFLKKKYGLQPILLPIHFLRMRPGNFPTIRLAQLSALIQGSTHLFSRILESEALSGIKKEFEVTANDYWHNHYQLDEPSVFKKKTVGREMIENLLINTVIPFLFAYGLYHKEDKYQDKALRWLEELGAENNTITKGFREIRVRNRTAFDSQALIELKTRYCDRKQCLQCAVGNAILKSG